MPSLKTASKEVNSKSKVETRKCEVLRAIGIDATPETIKDAKDRAKNKGLRFTSDGLTTMIYPNKSQLDKDGKHWLKPEPVFIDLELDTAEKLQDAGAVKVLIRQN